MPLASRLTPDTELLILPEDLDEYVVVRELVHLLVPNHGKFFKSFVADYLPE